MERLTDEDIAILKLERGNVRGHTAKILILRAGLPVERVRERVAARLEAAPRLRQRLVETPLALGAPAWVDDPDFELERHVVPAARDERPDFDATRALAGRLMAEPLPRDRPLWRIDVVERLSDGAGALIMRFHHAMFDGTAMVRTLRTAIFDGGADSASARPFAPAPLPGAASLAVAGLRDHARGFAGGALGAVRAAASPSAWRERAAALTDLASVLRRELGGSGDGSSALDVEVGPRRAIGFASLDLERVRSIGKASDPVATINDVVLAAVAGGLRRWLEVTAHPVADLRAQVPVSMHTPDEPAGVGNRDSFMVVDLPLAEPDPVGRLRAVTAETRERKRHHDAQLLDRFFHDLSHISHHLERAVEHRVHEPRVAALSISNVPGPREPQTVCGSPLIELYALAEVANRHALRVAAISAGGRLSLGLCADPDAVGDPMPIARATEDELDALGTALLRA